MNLLKSDDIEMRELGGTIYIENHPTNEDVEIVNEILEAEPIMTERHQMLTTYLWLNSYKIQDIL